MMPALGPSTWEHIRSTRRVISPAARARECNQQNAARVCAIDDEMRDAMGERIGLARTRSGNNKKGHARRTSIFPNAMFDGAPLFRIELFKIGGRHGFRISLGM